MDARKLQLDYYKFYEIEQRPEVRHSMRLQGQFDRIPERENIIRLQMFANPTEKNGQPFYDRNAHISMYQLGRIPWLMGANWKIKTESQFGVLKFTISHDAALLAPAKKHEEGFRPPRRLDHYKVYSVASKSVSLDKEVKLKDQFGEIEAKIGDLIAFAAPVTKEHKGETFYVNNEKAHLMIFLCETPHVGRVKRVSDQFGAYTLYFGEGVYLGVPCIKTEKRRIRKLT